MFSEQTRVQINANLLLRLRKTQIKCILKKKKKCFVLT